MLKVAIGSGPSEVDEVAAEVVVDPDGMEEEIVLVEMLAVVEVSAVTLVIERMEVISAEVEDSSVDDALVVVSVEAVVVATDVLAVDVASPPVDDVVTEEAIDSIEEEAELTEDVVNADTESDELVTTILGITCSG